MALIGLEHGERVWGGSSLSFASDDLVIPSSTENASSPPPPPPPRMKRKIGRARRAHIKLMCNGNVMQLHTKNRFASAKQRRTQRRNEWRQTRTEYGMAQLYEFISQFVLGRSIV